MTGYTAADANEAIVVNDPLVFVNAATGKIYSTAIGMNGVDEPLALFCFSTLSQLREVTPEMAIMPESAVDAFVWSLFLKQ